MKKIKIILIIAIIILCAQVTYARFNTGMPNGNITATVGKEVINLEYTSLSSTQTKDSTPFLSSTSDTITYGFKVNNYNSSNVISDVNQKYYIYVVFLDSSDNVKREIDCNLNDTNSESVSKSVLEESKTITVNGTSVVLPVGTFKFSPSSILAGGSANSNTFNLIIKLNEDSLPTEQITPIMKMYCEAEQNI